MTDRLAVVFALSLLMINSILLSQVAFGQVSLTRNKQRILIPQQTSNNIISIPTQIAPASAPQSSSTFIFRIL
jgi:hypothetical protein